MDGRKSNKSAVWGFYKKHSKLQVCFAQGHSPCSSTISAAHSLQKIGVLDQLEDERQGGKKIYSLEEWILDEKDSVIDLKLVGKKSASIFSGFCDKHDSDLFSPIEQQPLTLSDQQLFLFYYRGFAHSHHNVAEQCKFRNYFLQNATVNITSHEMLAEHRRFRMEYQVFLELYSSGMRLRNKLQNMLLKEDYAAMRHYYRIIPYKRIACSQRLVPSFTYSGQSLKRWESISQIILTVVPDKNRTIILFSYLDNDKKGIQFIDELRDLPDQEFTHAVSSTIIYSGMNTYFAPDLWDSITPQEKMSFIEDINYLTFRGANHIGFYHSKVNLFK